VQQVDAEGVTHCQWFTEHQNTVWLLKHWDQTHVMKKVGQKFSNNWELLVLQEGCCRTDHVYVGDPQSVNSVSTETIEKLCMLDGATHRSILMSHWLLAMQLHWTAQHAEWTTQSMFIFHGSPCGQCR